MNLNKKIKLHKFINNDKLFIEAKCAEEVIYICEQFASINNYYIDYRDFELNKTITENSPKKNYWKINYRFGMITITLQLFISNKHNKSYPISLVKYDYEMLKHFYVKPTYFDTKNILYLYLASIFVMYSVSILEYINGAGWQFIIPTITGTFILGELYFLTLKRKKSKSIRGI